MAVITTIGTTQSVDLTASSPWTIPFDAGTTPYVVGFMFAQHGPGGHSVASASYGGKTLTKRIDASWSIGSNLHSAIWTYEGNDIPSDTNDFTVTITGGTTYDRDLTPFALSGLGQVPSIKQTRAGSGAGLSQEWTESTTSPGIAFQASAANAGQVPKAALTSAFADNNLDHDYETTVSTGSRDFGYTGNARHAQCLLLYDGVSGDILITPSASMIAEATMPAPTIVGLPYVHVRLDAMTLDAVMERPVLALPVPRTLPTVGIQAEMPGRVVPPSGITDPVLTYVDGQPVYVAHSTITDHVEVVMAEDITDPPEPVWTEDGTDWVYEE